MPSAFVSHGSADDRYVQEMVQYLRTLGYDDVFNDSHTIAPDELFWERIEKGIRECNAFVVILSHASVSSSWVDREVQFARDQGKRIIPIRIDDCKLPSSFDERDVIELRQGRGDKVKLATSRITRHSPPILFGRDQWLDALDAAWAKPNLNVYSLIAWGGVGKTSLVAHWVSQRMEVKGWPSVERYFDWSFYNEGTGESRQTSSDQFIQEALTFFDDPEPTKGSARERGERLARLIRRHRTLLVLDGIEPLQYPVNSQQPGQLKDPALEALLLSLAADNPGLCIVTSREHLASIENRATAEEQKLDKLVKEAAIALLRHLKVVGTDAELQAVWNDAGGHALTLQLLGRFLADAYSGDIRHYKEVKFEEADQECQGRSAFEVMIAYERWLEGAGPERQRELAVLRLTGLFDRTISRDCLEALRAEPVIPGLTDALVTLKDTQWNIALTRLSEIDLLTVTPDTIDAHPLIREYFAKQLRDKQFAAFQAAHARLFDHLRANTHEGDAPTLEDLQPLYQAVAHGCQAGLQQRALNDVYLTRIARGNKFYTINELGAYGSDLGCAACFFETPWKIVSPALSAGDQALVMYGAAFCLRALGRLDEAVVLQGRALDSAVARQDWENVARYGANLGEMELTLGKVARAVQDTERSVNYADLSGNVTRRMMDRTTLAEALHQAGRRAEAKLRFSQVEEMKLTNPSDDSVSSTQTFRYCALILTPAEHAAWRICLEWPHSESIFDQALESCRDVIEQTSLMLKEAGRRHVSLRTSGLYHLGLGRVALYRAVLERSALSTPHSEIDCAVIGLRDAGQQDLLPFALLTRAWLRFLTGARIGLNSAQADLEEAWEIAKRGPMRLHMADIHLYRARLFGSPGFKAQIPRYPWESPVADLAAAEKLINACGYHRRDEEFADAKLAIFGVGAAG